MSEGDQDKPKRGTDPDAHIVFIRRKGRVRMKQIDDEEYDGAVENAIDRKQGVFDVGSLDRVRDKGEHQVDEDDPVAG